MQNDWVCRNCGNCCICYVDGAGAMLTKREVASGKYRMANRPKHVPPPPSTYFSDKVVETKKIYFDEFEIEVEVCYYLDQNTRKCTIYNERPVMCQTFNCKGTRCSDMWLKYFGVPFLSGDDD